MRIGNWEIQNRLVEGRWSSVFSASAFGQRNERPDYVVKMVMSDSKNTEFGRFMMQRELACANLIEHPHVIAFLDGNVNIDQPYLVSARINGGTLQEHLESSCQIDLAEKLMYFRQVCSAVRAFHQQQIRHGDLSPGNLMIDRTNGVATVLDLGLSEFVQPFCRSNDVYAGTYGYIAPECRGGKEPVSVSADIYSLGLILNELIESESLTLIHEDLSALANRMSDHNSLRRPTIVEVEREVAMLEIRSFQNVRKAA